MLMLIILKNSFLDKTFISNKIKYKLFFPVVNEGSEWQQRKYV